MNLVIDKDEFAINNVFFNEKIKNTVIPDSNFIRIIYSNDLFTLNGIYLKVNFNILSVEKYYNKFKCSYKVQDNLDLINYIDKLEKDILDKYKKEHKIPHYKLSEQLNYGYLKIFSEKMEKKYTNNFILKISGIWENCSGDYGLTYKFMDINPPQI